MRLIDADALKSIIDPKEKWILELIDEEPTAYDIDKVVSQAEVEIRSSDKYIREYDNSEVQKAFNKGMRTILNIVRKGGVG